MTNTRNGTAIVPALTTAGNRGVELWLWSIAALVFAMVVVGGATRLTGSGLSITEWRPILGAIPPLNEADWQAAFEKYKQIPQYAVVNKGMTLGDFKFIYAWEWSHRLLGRLIGALFALPFLWFWLRGKLRAGLAPKLLGVLALGGLQGFIGWYMVKSGLADRVSVSQYRLALHLTVAFAIMGLVVWLAREEAQHRQFITGPAASSGSRRRAGLLVALVELQVMLGALVAGLKAGLVYNTWPDMNGRFIPEGMWPLSPWYLNLFETIATVQFDHRMLAYLIVILALVQVLRKASRPVDQRVWRSRTILGFAVLAQMALGIAVLLYGVPLWLGLAHQAGAALVLIAAVWHLHDALRAGAPRRA
jgi:heme a synthase